MKKLKKKNKCSIMKQKLKSPANLIRLQTIYVEPASWICRLF